MPRCGCASQPGVGLRSGFGLGAGPGLPKLGRGGTGPSQMAEEYRGDPWAACDSAVFLSFPP